MSTGSPLTLAVDCGGGGIKASVADFTGHLVAQPVRKPTPYPLPPGRLVDVAVELAGQLPAATRVTVGMPGMIRHGRVIATPHYVTKEGPRSKVLPHLVEEWANFNMQGAIREVLYRKTQEEMPAIQSEYDEAVKEVSSLNGKLLSRLSSRVRTEDWEAVYSILQKVSV